MPSELKSETSRINGAKSHGPKTPEGKETSSRNSLKHGHTTRSTILLQCESPDEFEAFLAEHIEIHQPVTAPEKELVDQMAIARWRMRRFVAAETVLLDCEMIRNQAAVQKEFATLDADVHIAMAIRSLADDSRSLSLMSRYEARHQRTHDKAYAALRELQKARTSQPTPLEPERAPAAQLPDQHLTSNIQHPAQKLPNEPGAPPRPSPDIHLCPPIPTPESGNSEDQDA
jgi:hypothetical protein